MKTATIKNILNYVSAIFVIITFVIVLNITGGYEQGDFETLEYFTKLLWSLPTAGLAWVSYQVTKIF